jgi:hypothetical protein
VKTVVRDSYTIYTFRGPKSHRPVGVVVPSPQWMEAREEWALKIANARFKVIYNTPFTDDDWKWATQLSRLEEERNVHV